MSKKRRPPTSRRSPKGNDSTDGPTQEGVVIARHGDRCQIGTNDGQAVPCLARRRVGSLICGDRVRWAPQQDGSGVITEALPRQTLLQKPDARGRVKPVAANVDQAAIVVGATELAEKTAQTAPRHPLPTPTGETYAKLVDSYLVAIENAGVSPLLVINKIDLLQQWDALLPQLTVYEQLGYPVLHTSVTRNTGLAELISHLNGHTSIFIGQSGAGKSSLIKWVVGNEAIRTAPLGASGLGRHTTTTATLYPLPVHGWLIDSPGIREFGLGHLPLERIAEGFREFGPFLGYCRFSDCRHLGDPGCAIQEALARKEIAPRRLESYRYLAHNEQTESGGRR